MSRIKVIAATGIPFADAVKAALGMSVRAFATEYGLTENAVSGVINGSTPHVYHNVRDALAKHFEVDREWLDAHLPHPKQADAAETADESGGDRALVVIAPNDTEVAP